MLRKLITVSLFLLFTGNLQAEIIKLLEIPYDENSLYIYTINQKKKCSFAGVTEIIVPSFEEAQKENAVLDKVNFYQKKLNLEIHQQNITAKKISFSLTGSKNLFFEYTYNRSKKSRKCELVKLIQFNNKTYKQDHLEIDYIDILKSPVIEKVVINNPSEKVVDTNIYPWQLQGQMAAYELNLGMALNIHSNFRYKNLNRFEKNDPVIEPLPAFLFRYGPLFVNKSGAGSLLYNKGEFTILGMALLEGEPYKANGLRERKQGVYLGSIFKYNMAELTYYNDFFKDKGFNLKLNIAPEFFYKKQSWKVTPSVFIQYWDNKYVDYYFAVGQDELDSGLRTYDPKPTINYGSMLQVVHYVEKWTLAVDLGIKIFGKEVTSSPTVVRKNELRFITSVLYKVF